MVGRRHVQPFKEKMLLAGTGPRLIMSSFTVTKGKVRIGVTVKKDESY